MNFKDYRIGLVVGPVGLNDNQIAEIKHRIQGIMKTLGPEGEVELVLPSFSDEANDEGMPASVMNLRYVAGVKQLTFLPCGPRGLKWRPIFIDLKHCDEVWCCPGEWQASINCRVRVARIYHAGLQDKERARVFKLIPAWVSAQEVEKIKRKKTKKGKRHDRLY